MNTELKQSGGQLTVKELRDFLDKHEAGWTDQDTEYLGEFESQMILSLPPKKGFTFSKIVEAYGYGGFFMIPTHFNGEELLE